LIAAIRAKQVNILISIQIAVDRCWWIVFGHLLNRLDFPQDTRRNPWSTVFITALCPQKYKNNRNKKELHILVLELEMQPDVHKNFANRNYFRALFFLNNAHEL